MSAREAAGYVLWIVQGRYAYKAYPRDVCPASSAKDIRSKSRSLSGLWWPEMGVYQHGSGQTRTTGLYLCRRGRVNLWQRERLAQ